MKTSPVVITAIVVTVIAVLAVAYLSRSSTQNSQTQSTISIAETTPTATTASTTLITSANSTSTTSSTTLVTSTVPATTTNSTLVTIYVGENVTGGPFTIQLADIGEAASGGEPAADFNIYYNGTLTNSSIIFPGNTVEYDTSGEIIFMKVIQTFAGLYGRGWAQVQFI